MGTNSDDDNSNDANPTWPISARRIAWALVGVGVLFRIIRYLANRSLWLDEAYLAESLLTYTFRQFLTEPLLHWQAAPVGFLWLEKLAVVALGTSEYAMRFVPLVAGVASVFLFRPIAMRCLPAAGGLAALAMFATLEPLVYYSAEVKQYGVDVAIALAILFAALRYTERQASMARLIALTITGGVAIFFSHPAVFVVAGIGTAMLVRFSFSREWGAAVLVAVVSGIWALLFGVNYFAFLRPLVNHAGLVNYWQSGYMPLDWTALVWIGRSLRDVFADYSTMWMPLPDVAVVAGALGLVWLWRTDRRAFGFVMGPVAFALIAAMVQRFPFSGRLILFVVPFAILTLGAAMQAVIDATTPGKRLLPGFVFAVLFIPTLARGVFFAALPPGREEMKPLLAVVQEQQQPGDVLYTLNLTQQPYRYYRDRFGLGPDRLNLANLPWDHGDYPQATDAQFVTDFESLRGKPRVWVLLTHIGALQGPDEGKIVPTVLDRIGKRLERHEAKGAILLLYDLTREPAADPTPTTSPTQPPR